MAATEKAVPKQLKPWKPGQSGNPKGRPKGARNRATVAAEVLLDGEAETITRKAVELAKGGDMQAIRLCLERILPPRKDRPVTFELPPIESAADAAAAAAVVAAAARGELSPSEAETVGKLLSHYATTLEVSELDVRLTALEKARAK